MNEPTSPADAYKAIIDELVSETRNLGAGTCVAEHGLYSKAQDHESFNSFIATLTSPQRQLLARMLQEERHSAIHDVLSMLTWWIDCKEVGLTFRGEPMPVQISGMGLHGDYVGRCAKWDWPNEEA